METSQSVGEQFSLLKDSKDSTSLLKKYLTDDVFANLMDKKTQLGGTLAQIINSGVEQLDCDIGIRATDRDAYDTFSLLFNPVIKHYHMLPMTLPIVHPSTDFGDLENLPFSDLDPDKKYIKSTRVRVGRNVDGYALQSLLSADDRAKLESDMLNALDTLSDEFEGEYFSLETMSKEEEEMLVEKHFLFNHCNRFTRSAGAYRDWPKNRGIFCNPGKTFMVWICETDHVRIISLQPGGNLGEVYRCLVKGVRLIDKEITFARCDRLGYVTFCPTNLGTALRASVHIRVPKLAADKELFATLCAQYNLQVRGINGDGSDVFGDVIDISNKRRLGLTELVAVTEMAVGIKAVIAMEASL